MIFGCFYTMNTPYAEYAANWARSLDALGLRYVALGIPPCSWKEAVMQTGDMCLAVVRAHPGEMVVFTDADAQIMRLPGRLLQLALSPYAIEYDIGVHYLTPGGRFAIPPGSPECLNGTVIVWPTDAARAVLDRWCYLNDNNREARCADQLNLGQAIKDNEGARVLDLPPEYCWIPDMSEQRYGKREPVIVQHQASRKLKGATT